MKILILIILITNFIFAAENSILTQYRLHGLISIQRSLDLDLANIKYWLNILKFTNTKYGYIQSNIDLLTCNKQKSMLQLNIRDKNNTFTAIQKYQALVGKNNGDKTKKGDLKTPVGIYTLTKKLNKVEPFYGPLALVTSYPNLYDKYYNRDGYGIWIHGVPENGTRKPFTKGCIALQNNNLIALSKKINLNKTLVIINNNKVQTNISKQNLAKLLANFYMWRYSWIYGNTNKYLSFYSKNFKQTNGMTFNAFAKYKTALFKRKGKTYLNFSNIIILPYPNENNTYEIIAHEIYKTTTYNWQGTKKLIVKLKDNTMKILTAE